MRSTTLARWLVVGSLAGFGLLVGARMAGAQEPTPTPVPTPVVTAAAAPAPTPAPVAAAAAPAPAPAQAPAPATTSGSGGSGSAVQGSNSATDAESLSGDAGAANEAAVAAGPGAAQVGGGGQSSQIGNNDVRVTQRSSAKTGDAVAGGQVIGVVGGNAVIQAQNSSFGAVAESGSAFAENSLDIVAGPSAGGGSAQQIGDNRVRVVQESLAESGSAVAGSQITGLVDADGVVQNQNSSDGAEAISGDAEAFNDALIEVGPFADGFDGGANAAQVGDNDAVLEQSSEARSGDAVAGGQVTGSVGGDATVQNQNSSTDPVAESGGAFAENIAEVLASPRAGPAFDNAQSSQNGDNDVDVLQETRAVSGDAVAGSQVTGLVSEERGHLAVQNQQSSDAPIAITGDAEALNELIAEAGPAAEADGDVAQASQIGDSDVDVVQITEAETGDAVAGAQVVGAVGGDGVVSNQNTSFDAEAISGDAVAESVAEVSASTSAFADFGTASAAQDGDNDVALEQETRAVTGDAVAGGQVVGLADAGDVFVSGQNFADAPLAESGSAFVTNDALVASGTSALSDDIAQASQIGDNDTSLAQLAEAVTGDAVAGSGVFGIVGDDAVVQAQNTSFDAEAISGDSEVENIAEVASGVTAEAFDGPAQASQFGDNDTSFDQIAIGETGDAVAGSQVLGGVGGRDATAQLQNSSDGSIAESGGTFVLNEGLVASGPVALADGFAASASQVGDNDLDISQEIEASTGDAVAGGQVAGLVNFRDATVQGQNDSVDDEALSADAEAENAIEGTIGPFAEGFDADAATVQNGDNDLRLDQELEAETGDAVSGGQVFGQVA